MQNDWRDSDGDGGMPATRNGARVVAAFEMPGGAWVVLVDRVGEYVVATAATGERGWVAGSYFSFPQLLRAGDLVEARALALGRARATFLLRAGEASALRVAVSA